MSDTLEDLGLILRTEREKKFLSVEDVADGLKISARVLRAIEAGDTSSLPHAVYVRGFVSAYGKFLELDVQELLATPALYDDDEVQKAPPVKTAPVRKNTPKINIPLILLLCFLLAGGFGVWFYRDAALFSSYSEEHLSTAQPAPALPQKKETSVNTSSQASASSSAAKAVPPTAPKKAEEAVKVESTKPKQAQESAEKKPEKKPEEPSSSPQNMSGQEASEQKSLAQAPVVTAPKASSAPPQQPLQGPHKIIITALVNTWIHSSADGAGTRQFSLKPGDTFALTFDESLKLTLGNAGGVRIHYNGKALSGLGQNGEEKTITFPLKM